MSYKVYARVLKWLTLSLLAYPFTVFIVAEPWPTILRATFLPHIEFNFQFLFIITGVLGTTISPYMFFWQASEDFGLGHGWQVSGLVRLAQFEPSPNGATPALPEVIADRLLANHTPRSSATSIKGVWPRSEASMQSFRSASFASPVCWDGSYGCSCISCS